MNTRGNALFLILIAVALFAALSYAITSSGRGGGSIDREQASLMASQITQYAASLERGLQRMQILNGCSDTQISFWHDSNGDAAENASDNYYNVSSPTDHSCHMFDPDGGSVVFRPASDFGADHFVFPDDVCLDGIGTGVYADCLTDGTDSTDMIFGLGEIDQSVCQAIVDNVGDGTIYTDGGNSWLFNSYFTGTFDEGFAIHYLGAGAPPVVDYSGCVVAEALPAGRYNYYHTLKPR